MLDPILKSQSSIGPEVGIQAGVFCLIDSLNAIHVSLGSRIQPWV